MRSTMKLLLAGAVLISTGPALAEPGIDPGIALGTPAPVPTRMLKPPSPRTRLRTGGFRYVHTVAPRTNRGTHGGVDATEGARRPHPIGGPAAAFSAGGGGGLSISPDRMIGLK